MLILRIVQTGDDPERVRLEIEGGETVELAWEVTLRAGLSAGGELSRGELAGLVREDRLLAARAAALDLLAVRARTRSELAGRLRRKGHEPEIAADCVARLAAQGLVDDEAFAELFVRDRLRLRPRGGRGLMRELRARGVDAETAERVVGRVMDAEEVSEVELAREAASRWTPKRGADPVGERRRLYAYLTRRGFGADAIRTVVEEMTG